MQTPAIKDKIEGYIDEYSKTEPGKMNDEKIVELAKRHF
jgi:hypothetical protein